MRAWSGALAGIGLIAVAYLGDQTVGAAVDEARRTFDASWMLTLEVVARLIAVGLMVGLGWLVLRGARARLPGAVMLVVGGYFALVPGLSFAFLANAGISLPPFAWEAYQYWTSLTLWAGAVVMVLGLVELIWPTPEPEPVSQQSGTNTAPVSQQP
jgi:hypothetical protein